MSDHRKLSRITIMQMFHELKQQFPTVPDEVNSVNREACIANLTIIQKNYVQQMYPSDIVDKMAIRPKSLEMLLDNHSLTNFSNIDFNTKNCQSPSISAPATPSQPINCEQRHKSSLSLDSVSLVDIQCRPFTSVSLTLRKPFKEQPLPPLDLIASSRSELTYTACSYDPSNDPNNCYQSRLHISIDPEGETTVTTSRIMISPTAITSTNRTTDTHLPGIIHTDNISPRTKLTITAQIERKQKLASELIIEKEKLEIIKKSIASLEANVSNKHSKLKKVEQLRNDVEILKLECNRLTLKVNEAKDNTAELFETNEQISMEKNISVDEYQERQNWVCPMCTFQNHPILPRCEQCDMARFDLGTTSVVNNVIPLCAKLTSNLTTQCLT
ncbi:uncharacterized protein LOC126894614 isoform X2 [Daktulosphaira vitifoliae]|uniref:uncharacterized protein LOC126894614 isoform X2 n=1 Tax=Daktulosphaira vitifoliae TaxID=58002 RepID=UPI0021AA5E41|nr:uncharacterized protein LOC126894614 isoform X2 [Daktulosphaira vitifoliae]